MNTIVPLPGDRKQDESPSQLSVRVSAQKARRDRLNGYAALLPADRVVALAVEMGITCIYRDHQLRPGEDCLYCRMESALKALSVERRTEEVDRSVFDDTLKRIEAIPLPSRPTEHPKPAEPVPHWGDQGELTWE